MTKQLANNNAINFRLHIAFIISLVLLTLCFYFFQRFSQFGEVKNHIVTLTIELIEIPITLQKKILHPHRLIPDTPVQIDDMQILDSIFVTIQNKATPDSLTENDSLIIAYISSIFPKLLEINNFDPQSIIDASKKVYNFKNYFAYRLTLPDTGKPHEPSSPLVDEALNGSMGRPNEMISVILFQVPLSSSRVKNVNKERLTLDDLLNIKEHFHLLEYLYEKPGLSLVELYKIKMINESYTYVKLSKAIDVLWEQGLVGVSIDKNIKYYSFTFTVQEMIDQINRILTTTPKKDHQNREYLYGLVNQLITWS